MNRKRRDKTDKAFFQGFKSGIRGHDAETCPYSLHSPEGSNARGLWYGGWREGRMNYLSGFTGLGEIEKHGFPVDDQFIRKL